MNLKKLVTSGVLLAVGMLLPFLTGNIPQIGRALAPMHIPVLICGFVCGWKYGLCVGVILPLLRSVTFGMPALYPMAAAMAFELAAYGAASGLLYKLLPKKIAYIYVSLVAAMLIGRAVWGAAMYALALIDGGAFAWAAFTAGAFVNAVPGIILHIAVIPFIVMGLKKAGVAFNE